MIKVVVVLITISISGQALSSNPTLERVGNNRQDYTRQLTQYIDPNIDVAGYDCRLGVPHGYHKLIGQEVFFISDDGTIHGPWLITDVEAPDDAPHMEENNLLADVDCPEMVHKKGRLVLAVYFVWFERGPSIGPPPYRTGRASDGDGSTALGACTTPCPIEHDYSHAQSGHSMESVK